MLGYNARLQFAMLRRDAALARMNCSGAAATAAARAELDRTANAIDVFVSREIEHTRDVVETQIDRAQDAYSRELEHTRTTIDTTLNGIGSGLNPANIVRAHPWGMTLGALVAGALLAPLIRKQFLAPAPEADRVDSGASDEASTKNNGKHLPKRDPLMDALLACLPSLVTALTQNVTKADKAPPSSPASEACSD